MKVLWILFLVLGALLILFNIPAYSSGAPWPEIDTTLGRIGYAIGFNLGFILGGLFLLISYLVRKKWKRKKLQQQYSSFLEQAGSDNAPQ